MWVSFSAVIYNYRVQNLVFLGQYESRAKLKKQSEGYLPKDRSSSGIRREIRSLGSHTLKYAYTMGCLCHSGDTLHVKQQQQQCSFCQQCRWQVTPKQVYILE